MWPSAVRCEMTSLPAMSLLLRPSATSRAISVSLRVSGPILPGAWAPDGLSVRAYATASPAGMAAPRASAARKAASPSPVRVAATHASRKRLR